MHGAATRERGRLEPLLVHLGGDRAGRLVEHGPQRGGQVEAGREAADPSVARLVAAAGGKAAEAGAHVLGHQRGVQITGLEPGPERGGQVPEDHVVVQR